ncbi:MAG: N-acetylmuramoyl-L-alanine amidase [Lachnospiraceae bacterium]|nr:N-acetylmuramoyl-L-alanine amidase [Lachnospiraceae bacterium]
MYESNRRETWRKRKATRRRRKTILFCTAAVLFGALVMGAIGKGKSTATGAVVEKETASVPEILGTSDAALTAIYQESTSAPKETGKPCVVIDAGHGGEESPGAVFDGICEREVNLEIAKLVKDMLEEKGYSVIMTQTKNENVSLKERVRIANEADAALFVSIHQNSLDDDTITSGIETWYDEGKTDGSARLAQIIQSCTTQATGAKDRGLKTASDLVVIRDTDMPSCLVETGFLSSKQERRLLTDPDYQRKLAEGIVEGILTYLAEDERV